MHQVHGLPLAHKHPLPDSRISLPILKIIALSQGQGLAHARQVFGSRSQSRRLHDLAHREAQTLRRRPHMPGLLSQCHQPNLPLRDQRPMLDRERRVATILSQTLDPGTACLLLAHMKVTTTTKVKEMITKKRSSAAGKSKKRPEARHRPIKAHAQIGSHHPGVDIPSPP